MTDSEAAALLRRITTDPDIFGGKPIIRGRRLAVEHVLTNLTPGIPLKTSFRISPSSTAMTFGLAFFTPQWIPADR